jgi:hypothetical protein
MVRRRHTAAIVGVTVALVAVPAVLSRTSHAGRYVAPAPACGTARWPVKTLSDAAAASVDPKLVPATVLGLTTLLAPPHIGNTLPRQTGYSGTEFKTFKMTVRFVGWMSEGDSDIHLEVRALQGPQTMVVEFPLAGCIAKSASVSNRRKMARTKNALLAACGEEHPPTTSMRTLTGTATISGVGFFDKTHGQNGGADNGIELHPVLRFASADCRAGP